MSFDDLEAGFTPMRGGMRRERPGAQRGYQSGHLTHNGGTGLGDDLEVGLNSHG